MQSKPAAPATRTGEGTEAERSRPQAKAPSESRDQEPAVGCVDDKPPPARCSSPSRVTQPKRFQIVFTKFVFIHCVQTVLLIFLTYFIHKTICAFVNSHVIIVLKPVKTKNNRYFDCKLVPSHVLMDQSWFLYRVSSSST